jgi:hypothetical protein
LYELVNLVVVFVASVNEYLDSFSHDVNLLNLVLKCLQRAND